MFDNLVLGQYKAGDTIIHGIDPRAKLCAVALAMAGMWSRPVGSMPVGAFVLWPFLLLTLHAAKIELRYLLRGLKSLRWLLLGGVALHALTTPGSALWPFSLVGIGWSVEGTLAGLAVALQLGTAAAAAAVLTLTTAPDALATGMSRLLRPLEKLGLPVEEFFLSVVMALEFFPILGEEWRSAVERGNVRSGFRGRLELAAIVVRAVLRRADELAGRVCATPPNGCARQRFGPLEWLVVATGAFILICTLSIG